MLNKVFSIVFVVILGLMYFLNPSRFNINLILNNTLLFGMLYVSVLYYLLQESINSRLSFQLKRYMISLYDLRYFFIIYFVINLIFSSRYINFYSASYFNEFTTDWFSTNFYYARQFIYLALIIGSLYYIKLKQVPEVYFNYLLLFLLSFLFILFSYDLLAFVQDVTIQEFWQSTIWTFYLFINLLTCLFAIIIIIQLFSKAENTSDFIKNISSQLFGFNIFWSYLFFCQLVIIYYANIPSESYLYNIRFMPPWILYQGLVIFLHLIIPAIFLFTKRGRSSRQSLLIASYSTIMAVALDLMCYFIPTYSQFGITIFEYTFFIFSFVIFMILFMHKYLSYKKAQIIMNDNNLQQTNSLNSIDNSNSLNEIESDNESRKSDEEN